MIGARRTASIVALLGLVGLAGCAHVAPDDAFGDVRSLVADRGLPDPQWHRDPAQDATVQQAVRALLAHELTPRSAAEIALLNNRSLQAELENLGIAQAEVVHASRVMNPVLVGSPRFSDRSGTNLDLGITQNLLQLLVRPARKQLAGAQLEETQLRVAHEVLGVAAKTQIAYFELVGAQQVQEMRQLVADAAESSFGLAGRIHEAGNLSDLQLANERILYEEARVEVARSEILVRAAREHLNRLMGLWGNDVDWVAADRLPDLPQEEAPLQDLESLAIARRLDLAAEIQSVEVAALALGITRDWRYFLTAEIGPSAERETDGEWLVGPSLGLELPIFDQRQAEIAQEQGRLRQRTDRMTALAVDIRSEVRTLRDRLVMTRDLLEHYRDVVIPLRERIVSLTEEQYNYMLVGAFELLLSKQSEYAAYRDYIEAVRDYWITRVELEQAVGGSLAAPQSSEPAPPPASDRNADVHSGHQHGEQR